MWGKDNNGSGEPLQGPTGPAFQAEEVVAMMLRTLEVRCMSNTDEWITKRIICHSTQLSPLGHLMIHRAHLLVPGEPPVNLCIEAFVPGRWQHYVDVTPKREAPSGIIH